MTEKIVRLILQAQAWIRSIIESWDDPSFDENGKHIPVTVVKLISNFITQVKTQDKDGYEAYQVGYGSKKERNLTKPVSEIKESFC